MLTSFRIRHTVKIIAFVLFSSISITKGQSIANLLTFPSNDSLTAVSEFHRIGNGYLVVLYQNIAGNQNHSVILKLDSSGNPLSTYAFPFRIPSLNPCSDGGYIYLGRNPVNHSYFFVKCDSDFVTQWAKVPDQKLNNSSSSEYFVFEKDHHYYINSHIGGNNFYVHSDYTNLWMIWKFDAVGNQVDQIIFGDTLDSGGAFHSWYNGVALSDDDPAIYLYGHVKQVACQSCCWKGAVVTKLDTALNIIWSYGFNVYGSFTCDFLKILDSGNLLFGTGAWINGCVLDNYIIEADTSGNVQYQRKHSVSSGTYFSNDDFAEMSSGQVLYSRMSLGSAGYSTFFDIADSAGHILSSVEIDFPNMPSRPIYISKGAGNEVAAVQAYNRDSLLFITFDSLQGPVCAMVPHVTGDSAISITKTTLNFDTLYYQFTFSDTLLPSPQQVIVNNFDACSFATPVSGKPEKGFGVYPNPSAGELIVSDGDDPCNCYLEIYNCIGVKLFSEKIEGSTNSVHPGLNAGVYILAIPQRNYFQKIIIR
jgi:hypothetical protein